ncbi:MAG: hypothetical protein ACI83W_002168, partial [Marinoscillum sp.]
AIVVNTMNELHLKGLQEEEKEIKKFVHIEHEQLIDHMEQMEKELGKIKKLLKKKGAK